MADEVQITFFIVNACMIFNVVLSFTFSILLLVYEKDLDAEMPLNVSYITQIKEDWTAVPFVELSVTTETYCPEGSTEVFSRPWYGIRQACDCLDGCSIDLYGSDKDWCYEMVENQECTGFEQNWKCDNVDPWNLVWQSQFYSVRVCGITGGDPYLNVTLPDTDGYCPEGTSPCLVTTSAENTVCYPAADLAAKCPITDIQIVQNGATVPTDYTTIPFNSTASVIYSKKVPQLPPTTIKIEYEPCMDSYQQSAQIGQPFYGPEMMQGQCETEKMTGLLYDPRFSVSGLYTNLYDVYADNGVADILKNERSYSHYVQSMDVFRGDYLRSWNRPSLQWSLECEQSGSLTRQQAYEAVQDENRVYSSQGQLYACAVALLILDLLVLFTLLDLRKKISGSPFCTSIGPVKRVYMIIFSIIYLVIGSLVGVDLYGVKQARDYNSAQAGSLESIAACMDHYTTFDSATYQSSIDDTYVDLKVNLAFYWLTLLTFALVLVFYGLALFLERWARRTASVQRNHT